MKSNHDRRVGRPSERINSNSVSRGSRISAPSSAIVRGEPNRFVNVIGGLDLELRRAKHATRCGLLGLGGVDAEQ